MRRRNELAITQQSLKEQEAQNVCLEKEIEILVKEVSNLKQDRQRVLGMVLALCDAAEKIKRFLLATNTMSNGKLDGDEECSEE